uniref:Uncharacterized protein n=1 Tax=viral metagenome TaxID=1070528 RepID=A0A6C0DF77_9ZZZZ
MDKLNMIYATEDPDYRSSSIKFGICMATYMRRNGKSPFYLKRSLNLIKNQTGTNWHVYLVGDRYTNNDEFESCLVDFPKDKLTYINLPVAMERDNMPKNINLWKVGGSNAFNHAHQMALNDNCDYILHYDDDDLYHPKKIQILNYVLSLYPDASCLFHYSTHVNRQRLPKENYTTITKVRPNLYNVIHSSLCIHKSIIKDFKFDGYAPDKIEYDCGDHQCINFLHDKLNTDPIKYSVFIPVLLCIHEVECEALR